MADNGIRPVEQNFRRREVRVPQLMGVAIRAVDQRAEERRAMILPEFVGHSLRSCATAATGTSELLAAVGLYADMCDQRGRIATSGLRPKRKRVKSASCFGGDGICLCIDDYGRIADRGRRRRVACMVTVGGRGMVGLEEQHGVEYH